MTYYSTQRPVIPGNYPKPHGNKVLTIENFDKRTYCPEIEREAWGYLEYEQLLDEKDAAANELVKGRGD